MKKYITNAVIFDLDGTVADTLDDLKNSVNYAVGLLGVEPYDRPTVQSFIGSGAANLIRRALPAGTDEATAERILKEFRAHYMAHVMDLTCAYPGVTEMLSDLKARGFKLAITSNKPDAGTKAIADALFPGIFDYVAGEKPDVPRKPAPDMVRLALRALGEESAVYVGDSDIDVLTAKNAGLDCICVTWGFRSVEELKAAGGEVFVSTGAELSAMVEKRA
ncbi:MAG: HAD-IA family hydrolase [Clostridia bacterium]|nr:HAD-IA family hydrolase [Clostridia bacterium]